MSEAVQLDIFTVQVTDDEEWREIPGYEGEYEASSWGRVRSVDRIDRRGHRRKSKMLRPHTNSNGYNLVSLSTDGGQQNHLIHRLVAVTFLGEIPSPTHQVNHKDGDKQHNRPENLEWVTPLENIRHAIETLHIEIGGGRGEKNGRAVMTEAQVRQARERYTGQPGQVARLARELDVPYYALWHALRGHSWNEAR